MAVPLWAKLIDEPVEVKIEIKKSSDPDFFEMFINMKIMPGVHVYSSKDQFFNIHDEIVEGLGKAEIVFPATKEYRDFDGKTIEVFSGTSRIIVKRPYLNKNMDFKLSGSFSFQACDDKICYQPKNIKYNFKETYSGYRKVVDNRPKLPFYEKGLFLGIIASFAAGVLLSLTPCVYPMAGITAAVIGRARVKNKKEAFLLTFIYVFGLSFVYALAGVMVALFGSTVASFMRSAWVLVPIGIIFIILGASMFDMFFIQTPSFLSSKIQSFSFNKNNSISGIFIIGALSAFVVGPCISGPLLGLIGYIASTGSVVKGFAYLFFLAWGMSLILFVVGVFSGFLPSAGVWMEKIKHLIGIVLMWAAFYFMRPITGDSIFYSANIVFLALGLAETGLLRISDVSRIKKAFGILTGILILGCAVFYTLNINESRHIKGDYKIEFSNILKSEKPVILDFTAPWCVNCKKIEKETFSRSDIQERLQRFNLVRVDFDSNMNLVKRYRVIGPPAIIFIDKQGNQEGEIIVTGKEFERRLFEKDDSG